MVDICEDEVATVQFENYNTAKYQLDALITLYPLESIKHILHATRGRFTYSESAMLDKILKEATKGNCEKSLSMAVFGPYPSEKIFTLNCRHYLDMYKELKSLELKKQPGKKLWLTF